MGRRRAGRPAIRVSLIALAWLALLVTATALPAAARADDAEPPEITSFSLTPAIVDTTAADQTLTVRMRLTDDQVGVGLVKVYLRPAAGPQTAFAYVSRVSGSALDGDYEGALILPAGSTPGLWRVAYLRVYDQVENLVELDWQDLEARFGPGCASITNTALTADSTPPVVTAFSLTPAEVDTDGGDQTVTVRVRLTDDQAGVDELVRHAEWSGGFYLRAAAGGQSRWAMLHRVSGTDRDGEYEGTCTLRKGSRSGLWQVQLSVMDRLGNAVSLLSTEIEDLFGAGSASLNNEAATSDTTPPRVTSFTITPAEVDTEAGEQTVLVRMRLTDDLAGVNATGDHADPVPATQFALEPLIGTQRAHGMPERVSGTGLDGVYEALVTLPKSSKEGIWRIRHLALVDKVGNMTDWSPDGPAPPLPGLDGLVVGNTATAQQVTIERDWTIETAHTAVTFPAGTVVGRADDGRFAFSELTAQEFALDEEVPQEGLDGVPVVTLRLGIPGLGLSFSKPVAVSLLVGARYDGYRLAIQSLTEGAAVWADEQAADVVDGRCRFTVTHATRFAAGLLLPSPRRLTPAAARRGATLTITGKGFGERRGASRVLVGSRPCARYISWSSTRITCKVPAKSRLGRVKVRLVTQAGTVAAGTVTVKR
jgi:hypothetical protein